MKLARKLTLAFLLVMTLVLGTNAVLRIRSEVEAFREDVRRDHRTLARALRPAVASIWREEGEARALQVVEETNQRHSQVMIRWVWPPEGLRESDRVVSRPDGEWLYTLVPVPLEDGRVGAIEVAESLAHEEAAARATVLRTVVTTCLIAALGGIVTSLLGLWLVGRPVRLLAAKARRVGEGDLAGPLVLRQRDEIGELAGEMNAMCDRLDSAHRARAVALDQLRHADRLSTVGTLASGIAHELGTPLNVVGMEGKRIAVGRAEGVEAREAAHIIVAQTQRMTRIIHQLLAFARRRLPTKDVTDVGGAVQEALSLLRPFATRHSVSVDLALDDAVQVTADRGQIEQVITNVAVNGVQAMQRQGGTLRVRVRRAECPPPGASEARCWAAIEIADEGDGIPADVLPHVFEPFFTTKDVGAGTGLGLSVAYGIVLEHGGFIDVATQPGAGARFAIHLPAEPAGGGR